MTITRPRSLAALALVAVGVAALAAVVTAPPADAIPRGGTCPKGTSWSMSAGACVKKKPAPRLSPQEKHERAVEDLEGRGKRPDPQRGLALLEETCAREKHGPSCTLLGFLHARGRAPVTADNKQAMAYFERACGLDDLEGCFNIGDLAVRTGDYPRARTAFAHACGKGEGVACARGADLVERGLGGAKDPAGSLPMFRRAMELLAPSCPASGLADGTACFMVGYIHEHGKGSARDAARALAAYRTGCTAGSGDACMSLARGLDAGLGGKADAAGANKAYDRACTEFDNADACQKIAERLGMAKQELPRGFKLAERACQLDPKYCGTLAEFHRLGFGTAEDQAAATRNYKAACDNGGLGWCENFAARAIAGTGMAKDLDAGVAAYERGCNGGFPADCGVGARHLLNRKEHARALKLATRGCDDDDGDACFRLGWIHQHGAGVEASADRAFPLFEKACAQGSPIGCDAVADAHRDGAGTAKDLAKARAMYQKACEGTEKLLYAPSCAAWARMAYFGEGGAKDLKTAAAAFTRACEYETEDSCRYVAMVNTEAGGATADIRPALEKTCKDGFEEACLSVANLDAASEAESDRRAAYAAFEAGCGRRSSEACRRQADLLAEGRGVSKDLTRAETLYRGGCDAGDTFACIGLATTLAAADKKEESHRIYKQACEAGSAEGCNAVGYQLYTATGVRWDITGAVTYFTRACDQGSLSGCANVGELYRYGSGTKQDHARAFAMYDKACRPPVIATGCHGAGHYLATGEGGVAKDAQRAEAVLRHACLVDEYKHPEACSTLATLLEAQGGARSEIARLRTLAFSRAEEQARTNPSYMYLLGTYYRDGVATVKDPDRALEWLSKACEGFDPLGCVHAGTALRATGKPADADRARVYFERACAAGVEDGCTLGAGGAATGPAPVARKSGCCAGEVAPGAEAGLVLAVWLVLGWQRRRRAAAVRGS